LGGLRSQQSSNSHQKRKRKTAKCDWIGRGRRTKKEVREEKNLRGNAGIGFPLEMLDHSEKRERRESPKRKQKKNREVHIEFGGQKVQTTVLSTGLSSHNPEKKNHR